MRDRPRAPFWVRGILFFGFLLLYLPLALVLALSFGFPNGFHFKNYLDAFHNSALQDGLILSLGIAFCSTLLSTVLGTCAALGIETLKNERLRKWVEALFLVPLALPEIVMGISLLIWFVLLKITLGTFSLVLAHTTFTCTFVFLTVRAQMGTVDPALGEAARDLGATSFTFYKKILIPLLSPGILAGALLSFSISFDDFLISFFTTGVGTDPLPLRLFGMSRLGVSGPLSALSGSLLLMSAAISGAVILLFSKASVKRSSVKALN